MASMTMSMASPAPSAMSSMDDAGTGGSNMGVSMMQMVFFTGTSTPLFGAAWTPNSSGQYAGTCIFLIVLSIILRCLYAYKSSLERKWLRAALKRRYVRTANRSSVRPSNDFESDGDDEDKSFGGAKSAAVLTSNGVLEDVRMVEHIGNSVQPWRLSVDLPRALLSTLMVGIGYLLMLAVMTYNVGYFLSVLGGVFAGDLFLGRYSSHIEEHH